MYTFPTCRQEGIILLNIPAHVYTAVGTPQTVNFEVCFPRQHKLVEHFLVTFRSHHVFKITINVSCVVSTLGCHC